MLALVSVLAAPTCNSTTPPPPPAPVVEVKPPPRPRKVLRGVQAPATPEILAVEGLAERVGAVEVPLENPCAEGTPEDCARRALDRLFVRLDLLAEDDAKSVRILHLGDSHIAADYITGTVRKRLQQRFGDAGRGFVHVEQHYVYGGRRLERKGPWKRTRIIDPGQEGTRFGFAGMRLESKGKGARVDYALDDDAHVELFYEASPAGASLNVTLDAKELGTVDMRAEEYAARVARFDLPPRKDRAGSDPRVLRLVASGPAATLFGVSFTSTTTGLLYDAIGPVGVDVKLYLGYEPESFKGHLQALAPDLVVIMLGGNDALRIRKKDATVAETRKWFEELIDRVREALPEADCMIWSPMDAGEKKGGRIVSRTFIKEVRQIEREVAVAKGCGYWDMYGAMGGEGAVVKWSNANIMNKDLVHPRAKAGELLGHLFAKSFLAAYDTP